MPQTIVITSNISEVYATTEFMTQEFQLHCVQQASSCSGHATWAVRSTHGLHCPQDGYVCDSCKEYLEASWSDALRRGVRCANCHTPVTGLLDDHLRFIAL